MSKNKKNDGSSGKKSSLVILLLLLLVVGACGIAGYTFYEMNKMKNNEGSTKNGVEKKIEVIVPTYISLDTFTVSLKPTPRQPDRVLYIGLTLRVKDDASKAMVEKFLPEIRSRLLMLFSQQTFEVLSTDDGKQQLATKIKTVISQPLTDNQGAGVIDVLYNAFILR